MPSHNHSRNSFGVAAALLAAAWGMGIVGAQAQETREVPRLERRVGAHRRRRPV